MGNQVVVIAGERHVVTQCGSCAVWHTVPEVIWDTQVREGGYHHCPNGHSRGWKTGTEKQEQERIRRERDQLKQQIARVEEEASQARMRAEKAERATKRLKKRTAAGTCPCCQRTFANMAEHMKHQHPEFVTDSGAKVVPIKRGAA